MLTGARLRPAREAEYPTKCFRVATRPVDSSPWTYAVIATVSSTRVIASITLTSIVPKRGCGRTSHQMWV